METTPTGILDLPPEILADVASYGCQLAIDLSNVAGTTGAIDPILTDLESPPHVNTFSRPRRKKPFAKVLSQVCWRFADLVESDTSGFLWETSLSLRYCAFPQTYPCDQTNPARDLQLARFRECLNTSRSSDLDIVVVANGSCSFSNPLEATDLRLLMHGIAMLAGYTRRWRTVKLTANNPYALALCLTMINQATHTPRLISLWLNGAELPDRSTFAR